MFISSSLAWSLNFSISVVSTFLQLFLFLYCLWLVLLHLFFSIHTITALLPSIFFLMATTPYLLYISLFRSHSDRVYLSLLIMYPYHHSLASLTLCTMSTTPCLPYISLFHNYNNNSMTSFNEANIHYWFPNSFHYGPPIYSNLPI